MSVPPQQPLPPYMPDWQPNQSSAPAPPKPAKFSALAWTSLILGLVGLVACWVPIFNNVTAAGAGLGVILGIIALFGTRKTLATIGVLLCIGGIAATVAIQAAWAKEIDDAMNPEPAAGANDRGNVVSTIGEPTNITDVSIVGDDEPHIATVTITSIEPDPAACQPVAGMSGERGHIVVVNVHVETTAQLDGTWVFNPLELSIIGSDGNTETGKAAPYNCGGEVPPTLGPSQAADAQLVLDSAYTSGTLMYGPIMGDAGYEWAF